MAQYIKTEEGYKSAYEVGAADAVIVLEFLNNKSLATLGTSDVAVVEGSADEALSAKNVTVILSGTFLGGMRTYLHATQISFGTNGNIIYAVFKGNSNPGYVYNGSEFSIGVAIKGTAVTAVTVNY